MLIINKKSKIMAKKVTKKNIEDKLKLVLDKYTGNFTDKIYTDVFDETDILMNAFGITQELKSENKQYWVEN